MQAFACVFMHVCVCMHAYAPLAGSHAYIEIGTTGSKSNLNQSLPSSLNPLASTSRSGASTEKLKQQTSVSWTLEGTVSSCFENSSSPG